MQDDVERAPLIPPRAAELSNHAAVEIPERGPGNQEGTIESGSPFCIVYIVYSLLGRFVCPFFHRCASLGLRQNELHRSWAGKTSLVVCAVIGIACLLLWVLYVIFLIYMLSIIVWVVCVDDSGLETD